MAYLTWLADVLRASGLPVREVPGWRTRGHGAMNDTVLGVLCHHTAGPTTGLYPSEQVVVNGRTGLPGPLANLGLDRAGTWIVIAAGQGWHAGTGSVSWCPANQGNSRLIGVEAESVGTRDDWTQAQRLNYPRGAATLLRHLNLSASRAIAHREWATPPGRKIDPAFWDMNTFRADTARWMNTTSAKDWFDMATREDLRVVVAEVVNAPLARGGSGQTGETSMAAVAAWTDFAWSQQASLLDKIREEVGRLAAAPSGPPVLTDADVARVAAAVLDLLSRRTAQ